jgi:hypothetical protein
VGIDETWGQELVATVLARNTSFSSSLPRFVPKGNETITFKEGSTFHLERLIAGDKNLYWIEQHRLSHGFTVLLLLFDPEPHRGGT